MHICFTVVTALALASLGQAAPTPTESFPHYFPLADQDRYHLFWKFDKKTITFEVHVKTKGYVVLGVSRTGGMEDADVAIAWVKDGEAYIQVCLVFSLQLKKLIIGYF